MLHDDRGKCAFAQQAYVDGLPHRANPYWYVLEFCRHVGLKVTPRGATWYARIRTIDGRYHQTTLGRARFQNFDGNRYDWAVARADLWFRSEKTRDKASPSAPRGTRDTMTYCPYGAVYTVGHALEEFIAWKKLAATPMSLSNMVSNINYNIVPRLASIPLEDFSASHVHAFAVDILETLPKFGNQPYQGRTKLSLLTDEELRRRKAVFNAQISILRGAFELAWENGKIESERAWRCLRRLPVAERPRITFLSRAECTRLLNHCPEALRNLVLGGLYTGCRAKELSQLRVMDVGRNGYGIHVTPSKTGRARFVFLPDEGMAFFLSLCEGRQPRDHVFLAPKGNPWTGQHKEPFKAAVRAAGLPENVVFHGLRHTYSSQLVQAGVSLSIIARQLGHADTQTVAQTYGHLASWHEEDEIRQCFAPLSPKFEALAQTQSKRLQEIRYQLQASENRSASFEPRSNRVRSDTNLLEFIARHRRIR